jgi:thiol-disulfide isomerase/thioredoxin
MIRILISLTALTALITFSVPANGQDQEVVKKLRAFSSEGKATFENKEYDKAAAAFTGFIELLPKERPYNETRAHAHYYLACSFSHLKKIEDSLQNLDSAFQNLDNHDKLEGMIKFARDDTDLVNLHGVEKFKSLLVKFEKRASEKLQKFDFSLKSVDGKAIAKKDFIGKVLIVDIWGTWCPPCLREIPHFVELQKKYGKEGLQIIGLNSERGLTNDQKLATVKQAVKNFGINYPCALATDKILMSINVQAFPTTLFIGRDGTVRKMVRGYHPYEDLEKIVGPLLAEEAPAPKVEKSAKAKKDANS